MAIQQTKKQSDLEKRLKILRQQFYGRESVASSKQSVATHTTDYPLREASQLPTSRSEPATDVIYLHQDLLKILTFSGAAIGAQIILYFLINNHIVNLNFF